MSFTTYQIGTTGSGDKLGTLSFEHDNKTVHIQRYTLDGYDKQFHVILPATNTNHTKSEFFNVRGKDEVMIKVVFTDSDQSAQFQIIYLFENSAEALSNAQYVYGSFMEDSVHSGYYLAKQWLKTPTYGAVQIGLILTSPPSSGKVAAFASCFPTDVKQLLLEEAELYKFGSHTVDGEKYSKTNNSWSSITNSPDSHGRAEAASVQKTIYCYYGQDTNYDITNTNHAYSISNNSWSTKTSGTHGCFEIASDAVNGKCYITSGYNSSPITEEYDPSGNSWSQKTDYPTPKRRGASGSAYNSQFYMAGGDNWSSTYYADLDSFDPSTNSWTNQADGVATTNHVLQTVLGYLMLSGGFTGGSEDNHHKKYRPSTNSWTYVPATPVDIARHGGGNPMAQEYIYGATTYNYEFDLDVESWTSKSSCSSDRDINFAAGV